MKRLVGLGLLVFLICFVQMGMAGAREGPLLERDGGIRGILNSAIRGLGKMILSVVSVVSKTQLFLKDYLTVLFGILCAGSFGALAICVANLFHPNANPVPPYLFLSSLMVFIFSCLCMALNQIPMYEHGRLNPAWLISSVGMLGLILSCWLQYGRNGLRERPNVPPTPAKVDIQAGTLSLAIPSPAPNTTSKESLGSRSSSFPSDATPPFCWTSSALACFIIMMAG